MTVFQNQGAPLAGMVVVEFGHSVAAPYAGQILSDLGAEVVKVEKPEGEALDAARGETVARITRLNADSNDSGPQGPRAVEVYEPLVEGHPSRRIGVLESYLPYQPIATDVTASLHRL